MSDKDIIYGLHVVQSALAGSADRVDSLWVDDARHDKRLEAIVTAAKKARLHVQYSPQGKTG